MDTIINKFTLSKESEKVLIKNGININKIIKHDKKSSFESFSISKP